MVPFQLHFEGNHREHGKYGERNHLLDDLELHDIKGTAVVAEPQPVGWHLKAIFEKATAQLKAMTPMRGNAANQLNSSRIFRCPYQAKVMKMLEKTNKMTE